MPVVDRQRLAELGRVLTTKAMRTAWKKTVRQGLRYQAIQDLHDYLDVHRRLDDIVARVQTDVLTGSYRPKEPDVVTVEKKLGIPRRVVIPAPVDALVLQTITDALEQDIRRKQPFPNAYYSRTHAPPGAESFKGTFAYPWWSLWPKFQKQILQFAKSSAFTVTTDIANYFDAVALERLRKSISAQTAFQEPVMDFLFMMLEAFVWRPDYIPFSGVGLPQINFDAPRLLAHAFLFPADRLLMAETGRRYVRWMDDMDFGVDDPAEGRRILRDLDQLLASLGVRLNTGKTAILDQTEASEYFWVDANIVLTVLSNVLKNGAGSPASSARVLARATSEFAQFDASKKVGHWEKIYKRFLSLFGLLKSGHLEPRIPALLRDHPGLRDSILRYYGELGFSQARFDEVHSFMTSGYCCDDASWFACCQLISEWAVPSSKDVQKIRRYVLVSNDIGK